MIFRSVLSISWFAKSIPVSSAPSVIMFEEEVAVDVLAESPQACQNKTEAPNIRKAIKALFIVRLISHDLVVVSEYVDRSVN